MESLSVGLDIGSSAIRAAEIGVSQGRKVLRRYGQVGLPPGYVVDGEIVNIPGVTAALRRLWEQAGFSTTKVVLGVTGPRVFVRQAQVPALSADDIRSLLRFDSQELVPIPMEEASSDFAVLDRTPVKDDDGQETVRVLIVAAHKDLLSTHMATLKGAGLKAGAIDAAPLALLRVVPPGGPGGDGSGLETVVSIGAELTTVAVREDGLPRFIRSLTLGGSKLTESLANTLHLDLAVAENLKRGAVPPGTPSTPQARKALSAEMRDLAEDVRATVDFFLLQSGRSSIDRLLVTGGAARTQGLAAAIAGSQTLQVATIDPFAQLQIGDLGLSPEQLQNASWGAATAVGLALWTFDQPDARISILPEEVAAARKARRILAGASVGVAGVAGLLTVATGAQLLAVHSARSQVSTLQAQQASLQSQVTELQAKTRVHGKVLTRYQMESSALKGDVDWVRVMRQLAATMPANVELSSFTANRVAATGAAAASAATSGSVATVTFSAQANGGLPAVSAWLTSLEKNGDFGGSWVASASATGNNQLLITFTSSSNLTHAALSGRNPGAQP